jgi:membrane protease subunit HflK
MAWNQPDEQGSRPRRTPPAPQQGGWRRWRQSWRAAPQRARGALALAAAGTALLLWLLSGLYKIEEGERGVLLRFGAYAGERGPGFGWHLPWPIEDMAALNLAHFQNAEFQARVLTADASLVNASFSIQYQVRDARALLFGLRDAEASVRQAAGAEARQALGAFPLLELLGGGARPALLEAIRAGLQQRLDRLGSGLHVQSVSLTDVQVPETVLAAQRDVVLAGEERARLTAEAQGYAADIVARTQGVAQRQRLQAEAYRLQLVGTAEGDAARFEQLLPAYERAPQVMRDRLYIETLETILSRSRKLIIDGKGAGNTIYLPLDKMFDVQGARGSGVTGVLEEPVAPGAVPAGASAGAAAGAAAAASAGSAGGSGASGGAGTGPATGAAPAARPAPREDRSRERGER